jgi:hypothetical protein
MNERKCRTAQEVRDELKKQDFETDEVVAIRVSGHSPIFEVYETNSGEAVLLIETETEEQAEALLREVDIELEV